VAIVTSSRDGELYASRDSRFQRKNAPLTRVKKLIKRINGKKEEKPRETPPALILRTFVDFYGQEKPDFQKKIYLHDTVEHSISVVEPAGKKIHYHYLNHEEI
jgi:hypothetical protein